MHWHFTATSITYLLTGTITLAAAWINWRQRRQHSVTGLAAAMLAISIWSYAGALELTVTDLQSKLSWVLVENLAEGFFGNLIFLFVIDYYHISRRFSFNWRWLLWAPVGFYLILQLTNPWHHLVWVGFTPGPPGSNLYLYHHGSAYFIAVGYSAFLILATIVLLAREAVRSSGRERSRAAWMIVGILFPYILWGFYVVGAGDGLTVDITAIGYAVLGLLISWTVIEDLQVQVEERTNELESTIQALKKEVQFRIRLENDLRSVQASQAEQLAAQSQALNGLYNIILFSGQPLSPDELLDRSIEIIQRVTGGDAVCYYRANENHLELAVERGFSEKQRATIQQMAVGWSLQDLQAGTEDEAGSTIAKEIVEQGFKIKLCKRVHVQGNVLGLLCVYWRAAHLVSTGEEAQFRAFADALGIVLEISRLRQESANRARQQERRRLARDLHDSVTQSLYSLVVSVDTIRQVMKTRPEQAEKSLSHVMLSARQALKEMRLLLYELRLVPLEDIRFLDAIKSRLEAVEFRADVEGQVVVEPGCTWPKEWERELYPIAMESLNNALKHSRASNVRVCISGNQSRFEMSIIDDGCGFDPHSLPDGGIGLNSITERAERLGGCIEIQSAPGEGTAVILSIPSRKAHSSSEPERNSRGKSSNLTR